MDAESLLTVIILGLIEGLTEFLPVSSTGHLILAAELLGFKGEGSVTFKIVIQLGAILAVIVAYRQRFAGVLAGLVRGRPEALAFSRNVLLAVVPALVIGVIAYDAIRAALEAPKLVAVALIVGGIVMLALDKGLRHDRVRSVEAMPWPTALAIGGAQCLAMVPGVSRSGASILGGLALGLDRRTAAEFSFFLAVPTMVAATVYSLYKDWSRLDFSDFTAIGIGFFVAFLTALAAVRLLIGIVSRHGFAPFAWYRIALGSAALVWLMAR
ncbi:MAG: undecaprenyl-diphosphate phosphatase [Sphingomonadaceae bacterium]